MMNFDRLMGSSILSNVKTLTEAEAEENSRYGIPDEVFEDEPEEEENGEAEDEQDVEEEENTDESDEEEIDNQEFADEPEDNQFLDDQDLKNNSDESEEQDNINSIPKLKILNLSDTDRKLNNLMIFKKFKSLARRASENLNSNIIDMTTKSKKESQIVDLVCKNINDMIESIDNYILYKFDDVYEENVVVYNAFLKRYKIAMDLIRQIIDDHSKDQEE